MQTGVAAWFARSLETATQTGPRGIGVLAVTGTILTLISIWVIYRYLFRSRNRDTTYATFSF
jgi:predicted permease